MKRRSLLHTLLGIPFLAVSARLGAAPTTPPDIEKMQARWQAFLPPDFAAPQPSDKLELEEKQWRERLTSLQFDVLRNEGTERPSTSPLNGEKRRGIYLCAGCELPLFTSEMKYDSGTGWPSFFTSIPGVFGTRRDFKLFLPRTEYHCLRCGGHHGHVFSDGPPPTGERWCNNGVALKFLPASGA